MQCDKKNQMLPENSSSCVSTMMPIKRLMLLLEPGWISKEKGCSKIDPLMPIRLLSEGQYVSTSPSLSNRGTFQTEYTLHWGWKEWIMKISFHYSLAECDFHKNSIYREAVSLIFQHRSVQMSPLFFGVFCCFLKEELASVFWITGTKTHLLAFAVSGD